jgi:hypothetical protein
MATTGISLARNLLCHCWNADCTEVAVCPHSSEVHIFRAPAEPSAPWSRVHVLQGHDQLVSGIDWSLRGNLIVTVSHDRNAYVWTHDGAAWRHQMVLTRLHRAALCVHWSPSEAKFAIGSASKWVCVCHFERENNWWVSKLIKKQHQSSIVSVAWHPSSAILATGCTDFKCRLINAFVAGGQPGRRGSAGGRRCWRNTPQLQLPAGMPGPSTLRLRLASYCCASWRWQPTHTTPQPAPSASAEAACVAAPAGVDSPSVQEQYPALRASQFGQVQPRCWQPAVVAQLCWGRSQQAWCMR